MKTILHLIIWDWKVLFKTRSFAFWTIGGPIIFALAFGFMLQGSSTRASQEIHVKIENLPADHPLMKQIRAAHLVPDPNARLVLQFDPNNRFHVIIRGSSDEERQLVKTRITKILIDHAFPESANPGTWRLKVAPWKKRNPFPTGFAYSIPAYISMYIFFNLFGMLQSFWVQERISAFYYRILGAPLKTHTYFISKLISRTLVSALITGTLLGLGLIFQVHWGPGLGIIFIILLLYTLGSVALGYALSYPWKNPDAAAGFGVMLSLVAAALGGNWWPLEIVSPTMQRIGLMIPTGRMMDAFMRSFLDPHPNFTPHLVYMGTYALVTLSATLVLVKHSLARVRG